ncbi:MAG TPA: prephenate dehydrogenase/arogenate dehydrogenase family protein [Verrucomicrobiae bacterium]|nr:prephenate dehydrogenase/arogenate dehydrogenase family protein [Verrucomicrobiae bacterium]
MQIHRIAIIGLGLIGGSLGKALVEKGYEVMAVDKDSETLDWGLRLGAATRVTQELAVGILDAPLIILATPVGAVENILAQISPHLQPGTIVTDVGSVKAELSRQAERMLPPGVDFVGGHPMAGKEMTGVTGADARLFMNAYYVLTPGHNCTQAALEVITDLVRQVGAIPVIMDALKHDRAVAAVSHLPHLVAVALAQTAGKLEAVQQGTLALAAGSFRDGTRVAESSPVMWQDICAANPGMILEALQGFRANLDELEAAVRSGDGVQIAQAFAAAGKVRTEYKHQIAGKLTGQVELAVAIPNEPGALGSITKALGKANINIVSIEVARVGEGLQGSVVLGFQGQPTAAKALSIIENLGLSARFIE